MVSIRILIVSVLVLALFESSLTHKDGKRRQKHRILKATRGMGKSDMSENLTAGKIFAFHILINRIYLNKNGSCVTLFKYISFLTEEKDEREVDKDESGSDEGSSMKDDQFEEAIDDLVKDRKDIESASEKELSTEKDEDWEKSLEMVRNDKDDFDDKDDLGAADGMNDEEWNEDEEGDIKASKSDENENKPSKEINKESNTSLEKGGTKKLISKEKLNDEFDDELVG